MHRNIRDFLWADERETEPFIQHKECYIWRNTNIAHYPDTPLSQHGGGNIMANL